MKYLLLSFFQIGFIILYLNLTNIKSLALGWGVYSHKKYEYQSTNRKNRRATLKRYGTI